MTSFFFLSINYAKRITKRHILLTAIYTFAVGLIFELLQFSSVVRGTFDVLDICTYIISILAACIVEKYILEDRNEKNED